MPNTLDQALEKLRTPDAFRQWLTEQKGYVGIRNVITSCPLAAFLSTRGDFSVTTYHVERRYRSRRVRRDLPLWAGRFVDALDASGPFRSKVRASTALRILDQVMARGRE